MKPSRSDQDLVVTFFCKDPGSLSGDDCAAFYATNRGSWIVQGRRRGADVAAQLHALADDESFVEIPEPLVELFVRRYIEEPWN